MRRLLNPISIPLLLFSLFLRNTEAFSTSPLLNHCQLRQNYYRVTAQLHLRLDDDQSNTLTKRKIQRPNKNDYYTTITKKKTLILDSISAKDQNLSTCISKKNEMNNFPSTYSEYTSTSKTLHHALRILAIIFITSSTIMASPTISNAQTPSSLSSLSSSSSSDDILIKLGIKSNNNNMFSMTEQQRRAREEIRQLEMLQDYRLDLCVDRGKDWENCFMFGDSSTNSNSYGISNKDVKKEMSDPYLFNISPSSLLSPSSSSSSSSTTTTKNQRPPTW